MSEPKQKGTECPCPLYCQACAKEDDKWFEFNVFISLTKKTLDGKLYMENVCTRCGQVFPMQGRY